MPGAWVWSDRMKWHGGYNLPLAGRPAGRIECPPEPSRLLLPLRTGRLAFDQVLARDGQAVAQGDMLAQDTRNHQAPLLAPRGGRVRAGVVPGHLLIEDLAPPSQPPPRLDSNPMPPETRLLYLRNMGAWNYVRDALTGALPDPQGHPRAVIISAMNLEPFGVRGDVLLKEDLEGFTRGLECIQSILEGQPICLVLPDVGGELARQVRDVVRGYVWIRLEAVPRRYPLDDFVLLVKALGFTGGGQPIWALRADGVRAFDQVLTHRRPCLDRVITLGGPSALNPCHLRLPAGYPIGELLAGRLADEPARVIDGGVFRGRIAQPQAEGLSCESSGLAVLPEACGERWLAFARAGLGQRSYSRCFAGSARATPRRMDTAAGGALRACIACGLCEQVCPVEIMPHRVHKLLYQKDRRRARRAEGGRCIECGLCSYVCPSKIELTGEMIQVRGEASS